MLRRLRGFVSKNLDVLLLNPGPVHVYSGMVPGVIAGHYAPAEAVIDLARLARQAGGELVEAQAQRIDLAGKRLDRKSTRLNSSHIQKSRMPSSA